MRKILIVAGHAGSGQTTVLVNLASGLALKDYQVLIIDSGNNQKLNHWLRLDSQPNHDANAKWTSDRMADSIRRSGIGIDCLNLAVGFENDSECRACVMTLAKLKYDYIFLHPTTAEDCRLFLMVADMVLVCTDFSQTNNLEELHAMEQLLQISLGQTRNINLIIPNKINTKEWDYNSQQLFALVDYFGAARIADPIPYCERIHDLPGQGKTVWQLSQQNLQSALGRLVEMVELL